VGTPLQTLETLRHGWKLNEPGWLGWQTINKAESKHRSLVHSTPTFHPRMVLFIRTNISSSKEQQHNVQYTQVYIWQGKSTVVGTRIAGQILYLVGIVEMYIWYFTSILC